MTRVVKPLPGAEPRPAHGLVIDTFHLYRRYPLLFLVLAAAVILPYELLVLAVTEVGPFEQGTLDAVVGLWLTLADLALVAPLVSALHVHAVREAREGGDPKLAPIARQGLKVLPVVAAVSIVSWLGIAVGFIALIVPGVILMLRWFVVAQAAAIDDDGWLTALRRGADLTEGRYGHVFVFGLYVGVIATVPLFLVGLAFDDGSTDAVSFVVAVLVTVASYSFGALATALLYFDLRARLEGAAVPGQAGHESPGSDDSRSTGQVSMDPGDHPAEERPKGWYVDPGSPDRMRYWEGDPPRWSSATTRTPRKTREAWEARERTES